VKGIWGKRRNCPQVPLGKKGGGGERGKMGGGGGRNVCSVLRLFVLLEGKKGRAEKGKEKGSLLCCSS